MIRIPSFGLTQKQAKMIQEAERQMRVQRVLSDISRPLFQGFDPGTAAGDYGVEAVVRVNSDGSISLVSLRAETRAPRPDPGTDTTDNGLHDT